MHGLKWTPDLWLGFAPMDELSREFVERLAHTQAAADDQLVASWQSLVEHATAHFGMEDAWMQREAFAATEQHSLEHRVVLNLLREALGQAQRGELAPVRQMASELGAWFSRHTQTLDAALALHLRRVGPNGELPT